MIWLTRIWSAAIHRRFGILRRNRFRFGEGGMRD